MIYDTDQDFNFNVSHNTRKKTRAKLLNRQSLKQSVDASTTLQLHQTPVKQCRICLENDENSSQKSFITPCKCIGSVKFVHDKCYRKWIQRQFQSKQKKQQLRFLQDGIQCQICKERIMLSFKSKYSCNSCGKFGQKYNKNKGLFFSFLFFSIANLGCMSYLSIYSAQNTTNLLNSLTNIVLIIACFLFLGIVFLVINYYLATDFFLSKIWKLESFGLKSAQQRPQEKSRLRVYPMSSQQLPQ